MGNLKEEQGRNPTPKLRQRPRGTAGPQERLRDTQPPPAAPRGAAHRSPPPPRRSHYATLPPVSSRTGRSQSRPSHPAQGSGFCNRRGGGCRGRGPLRGRQPAHPPAPRPRCPEEAALGPTQRHRGAALSAWRVRVAPTPPVPSPQARPHSLLHHETSPFPPQSLLLRPVPAPSSTTRLPHLPPPSPPRSSATSELRHALPAPTLRALSPPGFRRAPPASRRLCPLTLSSLHRGRAGSASAARRPPAVTWGNGCGGAGRGVRRLRAPPRQGRRAFLPERRPTIRPGSGPGAAAGP